MSSEGEVTDSVLAGNGSTESTPMAPTKQSKRERAADNQRARSILLESLAAEVGVLTLHTQLVETFVRLTLKAKSSRSTPYDSFLDTVFEHIRRQDPRHTGKGDSPANTLREIELDTVIVAFEFCDDVGSHAPNERTPGKDTSPVRSSTMPGANMDARFDSRTQLRSRSVTHASVNSSLSHEGSHSHDNPPSPPVISGASSLTSEKANDLSPGLPSESERRHQAEWGATLHSQLDTLGVEVSNLRLSMPETVLKTQAFRDMQEESLNGIKEALATCAAAGSAVEKQDRHMILEHLLASAADLAGSSRLSRKERCRRAAKLLMEPLHVDEATGRMLRTRICVIETTETGFGWAVPFNKKAIQLNREVFAILLVLSYVRATPAALEDLLWCMTASTTLPQGWNRKTDYESPAAAAGGVTSATMDGATTSTEPKLCLSAAFAAEHDAPAIRPAAVSDFPDSERVGSPPRTKIPDIPSAADEDRLELPINFFDEHRQVQLYEAPLVLELCRTKRWRLQHLRLRTKELQANCIVTGLVQSFRTSSQLQFLGADVRYLGQKISKYHKLMQQQRVADKEEQRLARAADKEERRLEREADKEERRLEREADKEERRLERAEDKAEQRSEREADMEAMTTRFETALAVNLGAIRAELTRHSTQQASCCVLQ